MKRRRVLSAIGGGVFGSTVVGAAKRGPPTRSGPPTARYTGPMISAHEHLLFMPDGGLDFLVEWMDAHGWQRMVAFSTPPLLDRYAEHPSRFIPFNQAPFSRYALGALLANVDRDIELPPYLPTPDESLTLDDLSKEYEASLEDRREWQGIGEISLQLVHQLTGDVEASRPDAVWLRNLCGVAADHDVTMMLHPPHPAQWDESSLDRSPDDAIVHGLRTLFDDFPRTQFLVHGISRNLLDAVNPLLEDHDNWVYDVSGIMFGHPQFWTGLPQGGPPWTGNRDWVRRHFDEKHIEGKIEEELAKWEPILTEHPERVLWGVDSGRPWHFYEQFFDIHDRLYRGLLDRLPEADARKIAHVNARRFL